MLTADFAGAIDLKKLIIARENDDLDDIILRSYPYVEAHEKIEDCAGRIADYAEDSIPVLGLQQEAAGRDHFGGSGGNRG